jgi:uncharacterized RmlC-like cupin family protein
MGRIEVVTAADRAAPPGGQTPGMAREQAFVAAGFWTGVAVTEPGMVSGWHHHGDHDTYFYVATGKAVLEFGHKGGDKIDAGPGDFVHVPPRTVHRESNPTDETSQLILFRVGGGDVVVNVDGPLA